MQLGGVDAIAVLDAAEHLAYPVDDFPDVACAVVRSLIPCDVITFNQVFVAHGRTEFIVQPDDWAERFRTHRATMERLAHQHPLVQHYLTTGGHLPMRTGDLDEEAWTGTDLYREYFAVLGLRWQMVLAIPSPDDMMNVLALSRTDPDFSDRDVAVLRALRPHLTLGCRTSEATSVTAEAAVAGGWLVASVGADGTIAAVSDVDPTGTFVPGSAFPDHVEVPRVDAPGALGEATLVQFDDTSFVVRSAGDPSSDQDGDMVVLVQQITTDDPVLLSLTPRQRQVLAALADGCTNVQIARRLGIAESTVKKHLEHIYDTLDVDNRVAAVARISA